MIEINDRGSMRKTASNMRSLSTKLKPEMLDSMARSCEGLKKDIANSAASILPHRGGLASIIARMALQISKGATAVSLIADAPYNLEKIDGGEVMHPVYGNQPMVRQAITPGFWSGPIEKAESSFQAELEQSADNLIRKTNS